MTILFSSLAPVKVNRPFGSGVLPSRPHYRAPYTVADLAWLNEADARSRADRDYDRLVDELYAEAEATRLAEAGLC